MKRHILKATLKSVNIKTFKKGLKVSFSLDTFMFQDLNLTMKFKFAFCSMNITVSNKHILNIYFVKRIC